MKTEEQTQDWARKCAKYMLIYVILFMALVSIWVPFLNEAIRDRWFSWPNIAYLAPVPLAVLLTTMGLVTSIFRKKETLPFLLSIVLFTLGYLGLAISIWPWVVPFDVELMHAAASGRSLSLMLVGTVIILPLILSYTAYCYYVFRGKAHHENHDSVY